MAGRDRTMFLIRAST
ncbi:hypothetical protein [Burkholderia ubonensis]